MSRRPAAPPTAGRLNHILSAGIEQLALRTIEPADTGMLPEDLRREAAKRFNIPGGARWYDDPAKKAEYVRILRAEGYGKKERPTPYQRPKETPAPKPTPAVEPKPYKRVLLVDLGDDDTPDYILDANIGQALNPEWIDVKSVKEMGEGGSTGYWEAFVFDDVFEGYPIAKNKPDGDDYILAMYLHGEGEDAVPYTADEVMQDLLSRPDGFPPIREEGGFDHGMVWTIGTQTLYIGLKLWKRVSREMKKRVLRDVYATQIALLVDR